MQAAADEYVDEYLVSFQAVDKTVSVAIVE